MKKSAVFSFLKNNYQLLLIIIISAFLNLYNINKWQFFSYDQARDFLIIKKIIIDHKLTLIGPSLGIADGAYLPPLYYYLISPFLLLSGFHLWGADFFCALISIASIVIFYLLAKKLFGKSPAFITSFFYVFNPYMIQAGRHIRNPHLLPFFLLLFAYFVKKYIETKNKYTLVTLSIVFGIAVSLHITAIVFLPILIYIYILGIKNKQKYYCLLSLILILLLFSPLLLFDLRHGYGITNSFISFFSGNGKSNLIDTIIRNITFIYKVPLVLFSGNYQKELLSLRSMPIATLEGINLFNVSIFGLFKLIYSATLFIFVAVISFWSIKIKNIKNNYFFVLIFVLLGFFVSFLIPKNYSYFYYFYNLFPFLFLLLAGSFSYINKIKNKIIHVFIFCLPLISFFPEKLTTEIRPEQYFIPSVVKIAEDYNPNNKTAIASNIVDNNRWEKNGIEYRYFLEALYRLPILGSEEQDYKQANVLYLIDEGSIKDPLKMGGMEIEAFNPKKIENVWKVETGQTIYKLSN